MLDALDHHQRQVMPPASDASESSLCQMEAVDAHSEYQTNSTTSLQQYLNQPSTKGRSFNRRRNTDNATAECCTLCNLILERASLTKEPHSVRKSWSSMGHFPHDYPVATIDVKRLEYAAPSCRFCNILLSILRRSKSNLLRYAKAFEDPEFNRIHEYHSDGVSDVDARGRKVEIRLFASVCNSASHSTAVLVIAFEVRIRTQVRYTVQSELDCEESLSIFGVQSKRALSRCRPVTHSTQDSPSASPPALKGLPLDGRLDPVQKTDWICKLITQHARSSKFQPDVLPARLLKLLDDDDIVLIGTNRQDQVDVPEIDLRYIALSHRWGASQHLTTTQRNLAKMQKGCSVKDLPATFRDAFFFARQLGFRHLWIDALCIVQDSAEDWLQESSKMGDIFRNAEVTFAVHCAADDSEGFLQEALSKREAIQARVCGKAVGICRPLDPENDVTRSDLSRRGWVLQERFLSMRTLHFTRGLVYWETAHGILCEDNTLVQADAADIRHYDASSALSPPAPLFSPYAFPQLRALLGICCDTADTISMDHTPPEWLELVEMYSHCELTKEADKLIAISGMARKIYKITGHAWCAGLWSDQLCEQLLWLPTDIDLIAPTNPRAPSWSWAAWDGPIQYPFAVRANSFEPRCQFLQLQNAARDAVDWLHEPGKLTVRGRLLHFPMLYSEHCLKIGPGPLRKGDPANDSRNDVPRLALRHYTNVQSIGERMEHHVCEEITPVGWMAVDNMNDNALRSQHHYDQRSRRQYAFYNEGWGPKPEEIRPMHTFLVLGTCNSNAAETVKLPGDSGITCLGIFLEAVEGLEDKMYRRLGAGQMSWNFVRKELHSTSVHALPIADPSLPPQSRKTGRGVRKRLYRRNHSLLSPETSEMRDKYFLEEELATVTLV